MVYFTSDLHFGHVSKKGGIIAYCQRPFLNIAEMDNNLISNWNSVVKADDHIYVLGDFAMCGGDKIVNYIESLNGTIHFIKGSHDRCLQGAPHIIETRIENQDIIIGTPIKTKDFKVK